MAARYRPCRSQHHVTSWAAISSAFAWSTARSSSNDLEKLDEALFLEHPGDVVDVDVEPGEGVPVAASLVDADVDGAGDRAVVLEHLDRLRRASC